jgi:hypothetical protein
MDVKDLLKGDKFTIEFTVDKHIGRHGVVQCFSPWNGVAQFSQLGLDNAIITHSVPRPLKAGDVIKHKHSSSPTKYTIVYMDEKGALFEWETYDKSTTRTWVTGDVLLLYYKVG